jgi:hypothetical protein
MYRLQTFIGVDQKQSRHTVNANKRGQIVRSSLARGQMANHPITLQNRAGMGVQNIRRFTVLDGIRSVKKPLACSFPSLLWMNRLATRA